MSKPLVSVVLPIYNCEQYILYTINALQGQTYTNFEIIAIDDNSTDNSYNIVKSINDNRIKLYKNESNLGIAKTTNKAFSLCNGEYILQQDHDDISLPNRIEVSLNFLENNRDIAGISGAEKTIGASITNSNFIDNRNIIIQKSADEVNCQQFFTGAFRNPTCMFRKEILSNLDMWYDTSVKISADMDFFERINSHGYKWVILKNILLLYRKHNNNATKISKELARNEFEQIVIKSIKRIMPNIHQDELQLHLKNAFRKGLFTEDEARKLDIWYQKLILFNLEKKNL